MDETKKEYLPEYDREVQDLYTAFKWIIYLSLSTIVVSLVFGIIRGVLF